MPRRVLLGRNPHGAQPLLARLAQGFRHLPKPLVACALACGCVLAAIVVRRLLLADLGIASPLSLFYPALAAAALLGGLPSGLLALALSTAMILLGGTMVFGAPALVAGREPQHLALFAAVGLTICLLAARWRQTRQDLHRQNRDLTSERDRAADSAQAKSAFIGHLSHELRSPLNAVLGFTDLLLECRDLDDRTREYLGLIRSSGRQMHRLLGDALDLSRIEAGYVEMREEIVDIDETIEVVLASVRPRATAKGLKLELARDGCVPAWLRLDATRLRQILTNLVENALRHTDAGGIRIRLGCTAGGDGQRVVLEVADTGCGIPVADQQRIFLPFTRLPTASESGAGLGLSISRRLATAMGGSLTLSSQPGHGSTFTLTLPMHPGTPHPATPGRKPTPLPSFAELRILVVDDDPINRQLMERHHARINLPVRVAASGEEAVEIADAWHPHLIWMDLRLPGIDGLEASRRIRGRLGRDVRIVAVSASASLNMLGELRSAGLDDMLLKPFRSNELIACLRKHVQASGESQDTTPDPTPEATSILGPDALRRLPRELREELRRALIGLDPAGIAACTARLSASDASLGTLIAGHVQRLEYTILLQALAAADDTPGSSSHGHGAPP